MIVNGVDSNIRYHYSTWGNGPNKDKLVPDSLEECTDVRCSITEHLRCIPEIVPVKEPIEKVKYV
jgi:hypothetical protein